MAWNRQSSKPTTTGKKKSPISSGWIAAGALICAVIAAVVFFSSSTPTAQHEHGDRRSKTIAAVNPKTSHKRSTTDLVAKPSEKQTERKTEKPRRIGEIRDGFVLLPSGELWPVKGVITSRIERVTLADRSFDCMTDRMIASLLTTTPGEGMFGSSEELYADFDEEFEKSLSKEIKINTEDSDEEREIKQAVIELRKELKERKASGESLSKLMIDTRNQLMELAGYRDELEQQVEKLKADNDFSEKDEEDLIKAANQMLEDRGVKPFVLPSAAKYSLLHSSGNNQAEETDEQ